MANNVIVFNISKGRVVEYYNRVKLPDPATSALIVIPLFAIEADATLEDRDDLGNILANGTTEQATMGRKTLVAADLPTFPAPDDGNNRYDVSLPTITWMAATGSSIIGIMIAYDSNTSTGTDANIIPLTKFPVTATPDGNNLQLTTGVFFRAS